MQVRYFEAIDKDNLYFGEKFICSRTQNSIPRKGDLMFVSEESYRVAEVSWGISRKNEDEFMVDVVMVRAGI